MTAADYFKHYISLPDAAIFFGIALGLVLIINLIMFLFSHAGSGKYAADALENTSVSTFKENYAYEKKLYVYHRFQNLTQKFYEIVFSGNCILFFMTVYYLIERFYNVQPYKSLFTKYSSFLLLLLIILSCILNTFLDKCLIRLNYLEDEERSSIRILGMLYMLIIFAYIKYIYKNDNYDMYIVYFLGLIIGRFVYFDASFKDFAVNIGRAAANIPVMLLALACTGIMSYYGFGNGFLIKHIGVVTNVFIIHIFLCAAIFIVFHLHPENLFCPKERDIENQQDVTDSI